MAELQADGVFEEAEGNIRQQLMAAAQLARSAVQARQDAAQRSTRRDLEEARQLQAQLDAQRVSKSVSRVSRSTPGDTVKLDLEGLAGWAEL